MRTCIHTKRALRCLICGKEPCTHFKRAVGWLICGKVSRVKAYYGVSPPCVCAVYIYARLCVCFGVCVQMTFAHTLQNIHLHTHSKIYICTHTPKYIFAHTLQNIHLHTHTLHSLTQSLYFQKCVTKLHEFAHTLKNILVHTYLIPQHNHHISKYV